MGRARPGGGRKRAVIVTLPLCALCAQSATDWAENGGSTAEGVFLLGTAGNPDFIDCFGSDLSINPAVSGTAGFICDGSSDSRFDGNGGDTVVEPELNIVSPGGKQIQDRSEEHTSELQSH